MRMRSPLIGAALLCFAMAEGASAAAILVPGSTYSVTGTNFPSGTATMTATEGATTSIAGLTLTDTLVSTGTSGEWIQFNFVNPTGGGLAGNNGANWQINVDNLQLSAPALFDNAFFYWTVNGTPVSPINSFGGIQYQGNVNPITGVGPVFGGNSFPGVPITSFDSLIFVSPYSFVTSGGVPVTANDFHFAIHYTLTTPPPLPEPASLALLGSGLLGLAFTRRRKN